MEKYKFKQHSAAASNKLGAQVKITGYDWLYDGTTKGARQAALEREEESMQRKWASATVYQIQCLRMIRVRNCVPLLRLFKRLL